MANKIKLEYKGQQIYRAEAEADQIISGKFCFKGHGRTREGNYLFYSSPQSNLTIIKGIGEADGYSLKAEIHVPKNETFEARQIAKGLIGIGFVEKTRLLQSAGRGLIKYALAPISYAADLFLSALDRLTEQKVRLSELGEDKRKDDRLKLSEPVKRDISNPVSIHLPLPSPLPSPLLSPLAGKGEPELELEQKLTGLELAPFPDQPDLDKIITVTASPNNVSNVSLAQLARVDFYNLMATTTPDQWKTEVVPAGYVEDRI